MPPFAYAVTKRITWRGGQEEFSNVYHYDHLAGDTIFGDILDALVAKEKTIHRSDVTFVSGRAWGPTNAGQAASITRLIKEYSGAGTAPLPAVIPPELCVVASFFVGRSPTTQRKRFLRKYFHTYGLSSGTTGDLKSLGVGTLSAADKTPIVNFMNDVKNLLVGGSNVPICTPQGDHLPLGSDPRVLDHLHVRQFKQ